MNKKQIVADLRRVAAKLHRPPTRDEYHRQGLGNVTEHRIKKEFGTFDLALAAAKIISNDKEERITTEAGAKIARLTSEIESLNGYVRELEDEAINAKKIRDLIGSVDCSKISEGADWIKGARKSKGSVTGIPTLFLSDLHMDEVVKPAQIGYVNEYDHQIAEARFKHTIKTTVELLKRYMSAPKYEGIVLALGGDIVSGNIHEELRETNAQHINQTIIWVAGLITDAIHLLLEEFGKVFVPCVVGNHGRHDKKPRAKGAVIDNHEWLIYQWVASKFLNDDRVTFYIPEETDANFTIYRTRYNLNHGNQYRGGSGISGIFSPLMLGMARKQARQVAVQNPFDVMMIGHWHQYIHTEKLIVNGSMKGYDEYAHQSNFSFELPQQALWITHPELGMIYRMPVKCSGYESRRVVQKSMSPFSSIK